jgi:hypothetical protein
MPCRQPYSCQSDGGGKGRDRVAGGTARRTRSLPALAAWFAFLGGFVVIYRAFLERKA